MKRPLTSTARGALMLGFLLWLGVPRSEAFIGSPLRRQTTTSGNFGKSAVSAIRVFRQPQLLPLFSNKKDDNTNEQDDSNSNNDNDADAEDKDLFVFENMRIFDTVNQAITATAWGFLLVGVLLNVFGYDYIVKDGKLTVDTLEKRQFENEVNRVVKSSAGNGNNQKSSPLRSSPSLNDEEL